MVFDTSYQNGWAFEGFRRATQECMQILAKAFIPQKGMSMFCGKYEMNVDGGKRLWHGFSLRDTTPAGLHFVNTCTQGSRYAATLGFEP